MMPFYRKLNINYFLFSVDILYTRTYYRLPKSMFDSYNKAVSGVPMTGFEPTHQIKRKMEELTSFLITL